MLSTDPCGCNAVLILNVFQSTFASETAIRYAADASITQDIFNQIQHQVNAGATIPIMDVPIGGNVTYGDWSQSRDQFLAQNGYDASRHNAQSEMTQYSFLSPASIEAWLACKKTCIQQKQPQGLNCWIEPFQEGQADIVVVFQWNPPPGVTNAPITFSHLAGAVVAPPAVGILPGEALPNNYVFVNGEQPMAYVRDLTQPLVIAAAVAGFQCYLNLPRFVSLREYMLSKREFTVIFDQMANNIGSINPNDTLHVVYQGNHTWTAWRDGAEATTTGTYTQASGPTPQASGPTHCYPEAYEMGPWGHAFSFRDNGEVFDASNNNVLVGHLLR